MVSQSLLEEGRGRPTDLNRETGRRDPTRRTTVPELVVTISKDNGEVSVSPIERDIYDNEQVKWICQSSAWEVRFDQVGSATPFNVDVFGPGLLPPPVDPDINPDLPPDDMPGELSGQIREDVAEGVYHYSVQVDDFGPLLARVKVIRGPRPR